MMKFLAFSILVLTGCKVTQKQEISGEAVAKVVIEFPQAQECFDDERIETFEQLKVCLELMTNSRWTVAVDGQIVPLVKDALPASGGE